MTATLPVRTAVTTCAARDGRTHQAEHGLQLCRNHVDELSGWLLDVERELALLDARPSMQTNWSDARGSTLASHQTPARMAPLVLADPRRVPVADLTGLAGLDDMLSALDTLHTFANLIRDGREIRQPGRWVVEQLVPGPLCAGRCEHSSCRRMTYRYFQRDPLTVHSERIFLSRHLEWAATQPWAGELWSKIRQLRNQLQVANGTGEPRVGRCPDCGSWLHVLRPKYSAGPGVPSVWAVECDRDASHRWEGAAIMKLRLELDQEKRS